MSRVATTVARTHTFRPLQRLESLDTEDRALARSLADEFNRLTSLASDPNQVTLPEHSLAARVRTEFSRLAPLARERVRTAAAKASSRPGGADILTPVAARRAGRADPFDIDPDLIAQLRNTARRRLQAERAGIREAADRIMRDESRPQATRVPSTSVELRIHGGDVGTPWRHEINMASPEYLDFRWRTQEPGATRAYWELRGPVLPNHQGDVIASGYLPDTESGIGVGGYFTVPLINHLPPTPPQTAATYHMRILPLANASRFGVFTGPRGPVALSPVQTHQPIAPAGVGPWSHPAVIRYGKSFETPPQQFDIENITVYRKAHFYLDWFRLVEDQSGPGDEEYHIAGFLVQHTPQGSALMTKFGSYSFTVDPDDRSEHPFGKQATIELGTPNRTYWPRTLTAVVSIMEEDDGGMLNDWTASLATVANEMLTDAVSAELTAFLEQMRDEIDQQRAEIAADLAAKTVAYISALIAAVARDVISAFIALLLAWIMANIWAGATDDFYGLHVYGLTLVSNDIQRIKDGSAGDLFSDGPPAAGGNFTGAEQADGSFRLDLTELQFRGLGGALEGSPTSGIVNVGLHWEFSDKVDV